MEFVFYTLAALLVLFSYRSFRGGLDYLAYFRKELGRPHSEYSPFATIICPCKGLDAGLAENLVSLFEQDYPAYEVLFAVDDENDLAVGVIKDASRNDLKVSKLVVAPKATESSQKVENLREAVLYADDRSTIFVFVDSDARPSRDWLRNLVSPLEDANVGASTGYRWFISNHPTFASELRNIWNASIASALGSNTKENFCWGGSMAIRRDTFETLDIREKWHGTLSDDFAVTRAMNAANLPIVFVPKALTASIEDCSFREMLEFTTRQMKITRVYARKLWILSFLGSGLFCVVMIWSLLLAMFSLHNDVSVWVAVVTLTFVSALSVGKSYLRLRAVRLVLRSYSAELQKQLLPQLTLWFVSPIVFLINSFAALFSRRMTWRGVIYEMVSAKETRIVANRDER